MRLFCMLFGVVIGVSNVGYTVPVVLLSACVGNTLFDLSSYLSEKI